MLLSMNLFAPSMPIYQMSKDQTTFIEKSKLAHAEIVKEKNKAIKAFRKSLRVIKGFNLDLFKYSSTFSDTNRVEIDSICNELGIKDEWLYKVIYIESHGKPEAINPYTHAVGLIGFMPNTAKRLGTSTEELKTMTVSQQLVYVKKYLIAQSNGRRMHCLADVYFTVFYPAAICRPDSFVIGSDMANAKYLAKQNPVMHHASDSVITVKSIKTQLVSLFL